MARGNLVIAPPPGFNKQDVARAQEYHEKLCNLANVGRQVSYLIAQALYEIKRSEYYILLGYNSFQEYAESIGIGKSQAYKLASVYECYVVELGKRPEELEAVPDLDRVGMVVSIIKALREENKPDADERIEEILEDAKVLSRRDLALRKRELLGIPLPDGKAKDILGQFVGQILTAQERRIEVDGSVKVVLTFEGSAGRRRVVFYATGKDVGINVEKVRRELDRKDARGQARV